MEPKKELILEAAYDVLLQEGIEGLSMSRIAAKAKIPASLIFHYFKNKGQLVLELSEYILEEYNLYIDQQLDIKLEVTAESFLSFVDALFLIDINNKRLFEGFYACFYLGLRNEAIGKTLRICLETVREILKKNLTLFAAKDLIKLDRQSLVVDYIITAVSGITKMANAEFTEAAIDPELIKLYKQKVIELLEFKQ